MSYFIFYNIFYCMSWLTQFLEKLGFIKPQVETQQKENVVVEEPIKQNVKAVKEKVLENRRGTFIIADVYPLDLDNPRTPELDIPPFKNLVGLKFSGGKEVVGAVIKAGEGLGWGKRNDDWFKKSWAEIKKAGSENYGNTWFRGCYFFLRFTQDGAKQADLFCDIVEAAGGWGEGDLMPWLDIESGGQGSWSKGVKDLSTLPKATKLKMAEDVKKCATAFVKRFKERTNGMRIAIYGRGIARDLEMKEFLFGADSVVNPAYTRTMPKMDSYGVPLDKISFWQLCGDGSVEAVGFASEIPGWGKTDYSVYIDGANVPTLDSLRQRCLAKI